MTSATRLTRLAAIAAGAGLLGIAAAGPASPAAPAVPALGAPAVLAPVAVAGSTAPAPSPDALAAKIGPIASSGTWGTVNAVVVDPADGTVAYDRRAAKPSTPASTLKILTALTVLTALGPDTRLTTRVVLDGTTVTIVGAGDSTLTRSRGDIEGVRAASLDDLAKATAKALNDRGLLQVRVAYDDSLFTGPTVADDWSPVLLSSGAIAPVTALTVDQGRESATSDVGVDDPSATAARYFARALEDAGVAVASGVTSQEAPAGAAELAHVVSPTIAEMTEFALTESDNDVAEALAHLAGGKLGGSASFEGGAAATKAVMESYGLPVEGLRLNDGSGLSRSDRVQPLAMARALEVIVSGKAPAGSEQAVPASWAVTSGLPVAGFTGTLTERFDTPGTRAGRGVVRAKTGTLTGVSALAGLARDQDGRLLVFAAMASDVPDVDYARSQLDKFAASVASCGCGS